MGLVVFPELTLTGYSIEDILLQDTLLEAVESALLEVVAGSADLLPVLVVGAPLRYRHRIYNCAVVVHRGRVLGVAPKSYLPTYREFYERRQIAPGDDVRGDDPVGGQTVPFGPDLLFVAEDMPGFRAARRGVRGHVGADSAERRGRTGRGDRAGQPLRQPDHRGPRRGPLPAVPFRVSRCLAAYVYAAAGEGESTHRSGLGRADHDLGERRRLAQSERFPKGEQRSVADIDLDLLRAERLRMGTFDDNRRHHAARTDEFRSVSFRLSPPAGDVGLRRRVERFPFVPSDETRLELDCYEAYNIQVSGLEQRLRAIGRPKW